MRYGLFRGLIIAVTAYGWLGIGDAAQAITKTVTLCNQNALSVNVAVGFDEAQKGLTSIGWTTIAPCSCREIMSEDLKATEIFLHIKKKDLSDVLTGGGASFCVRGKAFRFGTSNKSEAECTRGRTDRRWVSFQKMDITGTGKSQMTINYRAEGEKRCNR